MECRNGLHDKNELVHSLFDAAWLAAMGELIQQTMRELFRVAKRRHEEPVV